MADKYSKTNQNETDDKLEVISIIEEAHELYAQQNAQRPVSRPAPEVHYADAEEAEPTAPADTEPGTDDGFVFVEEEVPSPRRERSQSSRKTEEKNSQKPRTGEQPRRTSRKPMILTLVIVGVLLAVGAVAFLLMNRSSEPDHPTGSVAQNVTVSGINVGGMQYDDALRALLPAEQKLAESIRIEITCGDRKLTLTKDDIPCRFNTEAILRDVLQDAGGTSGSYTIALSVDDADYAAVAEKAAAALDRPAEDAKVADFNAEKKDMFTYREAIPGRAMQKDALITALKKLLSSGFVSGNIEVPYDEIKPALTADELKENIRMLSSFTTVSTNTANGMSNQALALSSCNSSIIEPGATWSFNQCTGDSNLQSRGYMPAGVIVEGRHEIGIGGGICQSSTTIYNAALLCGMEVVERECHYYPSSYVDYGLDATIDYGNIDLKLRNPFRHQLFLKCYMDGATLHAEIYGLPEADFDQIEITTTEPDYGTSGYTVKASRIYYKDGKKVRTEALPSSTYYFSAPDETDTPQTEPTSAPTVKPTDAPTNPPAPPTDAPATFDEP